MAHETIPALESWETEILDISVRMLERLYVNLKWPKVKFHHDCTRFQDIPKSGVGQPNGFGKLGSGEIAAFLERVWPEVNPNKNRFPGKFPEVDAKTLREMEILSCAVLLGEELEFVAEEDIPPDELKQQILETLGKVRKGELDLKLEFGPMFAQICSAAESDAIHIFSKFYTLGWGHRNWMHCLKHGTENLLQGESNQGWPEEVSFYTDEGLQFKADRKS